MAAIGNGYGSECHLLRHLGCHRRLLDLRVLPGQPIRLGRLTPPSERDSA